MESLLLLLEIIKLKAELRACFWIEGVVRGEDVFSGLKEINVRKII